jgi:hypothetical protein
MFAKKCGVKARTNEYKPCRQPAMANGKCRLHGGKSIGPRTEEGKRRVKVAITKHGFYSAESIAEHRFVRAMIKAAMGSV